MKLRSCEVGASRGKLRRVATTKREGAHGFVYFHFLFEPESLLFHSPFPCRSTNNSVNVTHENWFLPSYSQLVLSLRQTQNIRTNPSEPTHSKGSLMYKILLVSKNLSLRDIKELRSTYEDQGWLESIAQHHHIVALLIRDSANRHEKDNFRPTALHHMCIQWILRVVLERQDSLSYNMHSHVVSGRAWAYCPFWYSYTVTFIHVAASAVILCLPRLERALQRHTHGARIMLADQERLTISYNHSAII